MAARSDVVGRRAAMSEEAWRCRLTPISEGEGSVSLFAGYIVGQRNTFSRRAHAEYRLR